MMRTRLPLVAVGNSIGAAAPTFIMVPGSILPLVAGVSTPDGLAPGIALSHPALASATVLVDVPDEDCTNGEYDHAKVVRRYPNHPLVTSGAIK